ncbi:alpha-mannosidase [Silvibacterium bohemicum]|uniref:Alpha-mannosidase n=1 Tax=Silvibacterium bohemicum TaxID=1577686 RepID=A0A841K0Q9_9BACT|nr:glycoside hydrolase family 38 C-terminal domain-containing protein [Silvibacterium bohemicum]MBB6146565.1 alpha-mannosidase [Silvibacterium bohemicum]
MQLSLIRFASWRRFVAALCCSTCLVAAAQRGDSPQDLIKKLPADTQKVIEQLGDLNNLPSGDWRYHAGDVPHGEATDLDDSAWTLVKPGSQGPNEAVWYRQWVTVPEKLHGYDLTGTRIWFQFRANANGPVPQIVYFNGRRVALGDDLEPIVLFDSAKPGERVLVAVKLLATVDKKRFAGVPMKIDFAESRPNPEDERKEILSAAFLLPSLSKNVSGDEATLTKAVSQVDTDALHSGDQKKFDASLRAAQATLEQLRPLLQQATLHLTGNSHIDVAWLWPWTETVDAVKRTFGTALQLMNEYPDYTYTQSAAQYNEWIAEKYPAMNEQIKQRIKEGRWEIVGGMWLEPDLNMPDGESTARSLLIGKRWFQKEYGVDVRIGWNPDSFGYNWQLPQIYKKSGVDYFVTQKMTWNDINQLPLKLFWWQSPDGSKVLTYFPHDYANDNLDPVRLSADLRVARERAPGLNEMMDLYGIGDHGGGPTRAILDEGVHWMNGDKVVPKMQFGTAASFFANIEPQIAPSSPTWNYDSIAKGYHPPEAVAGQVSIPTWNTELYLEYHRGVFTTQAAHKRNMRESSEWALNAEKYASLAWLDGDQYPGSELTEDWKKITFNQFHDLAAGSGIGIIYKDAQRDYDQVRWSTDAISAKALGTVSARVNTKVAAGVPVLVFNPLAWERSGLVTVDVQLPEPTSEVSVLDAENHVLPSEILSKDSATHQFKLLVKADRLPSIGYSVLHVVPGKKPFNSDLSVHGLTLENAAIRVTVDKSTGCITSLFDKKSNFESLASGACGDELQLFKDTPKDYDAWNIDPGTLDQPPVKLDSADSVEVTEQGPLRAIIRVTKHNQASKFVQEIVLYAGDDQVVINNDIDWHEEHKLLKAAFPLAASSAKATYEIPYGSIERPTTRNNSWEQAQFEVPALRWADLGDGQHGVSLINESKYGYDARDNVLRLSLLRSPTWPDPVADRGRQQFSFALYPHAGDWKQAMTVRHGFAFNYQLKAMQVEAHDGAMPARHSFVTAEPENVVLTAIKKAEDDNGLVFHLYEWAGKPGEIKLQVPPGAQSAIETNLLEQPQGQPLQVEGNAVSLPVKPYEIVAVKVAYSGNNQ